MSLADGTWTCDCGAWNAPWLEKCGKCDKQKPKENE